MRRELALAFRTDSAEHDECVRERREERAERDLVTAIAREVPQQARAHLPGGERQRRDRDRKGRTGDADRRRRNRAEERPRARPAAAVQPRALDDPRRDQATPVDLDENDRGDDRG